MKKQPRGWLDWLTWAVAFAVVGVAILLSWQRFAVPRARALPQPTIVDLPKSSGVAELPAFDESISPPVLRRIATLQTTIPNRLRSEIVEYVVSAGDSVFAIAAANDITPETILWSNYDVLKDDPHSLVEDMVLKIPPIDGVFYQVQSDDTLESVANTFEVDTDAITTWTANGLDLAAPELTTEQWVMIPGGQREFQQWIVPVPARGAAGVSTGMYGAGTCSGGYDGLYGSGAFIWPTSNHTLTGNDYWSGHLAIDIAAILGERIMASDAGVIMFAGWAAGGYGYTVAIDHGNGYQTLYAHLSGVDVSCGQSVQQGQRIGSGGSTGNSTGPHLHFEVRLNGGFVNPWYVLPAP
ncbi:MAG: LysM peptidoglycan-binding domain-containing M23 family metallopeptidase [Anaerolineae bacterium]|nr:LysM peptidoglycan-binding domain-containing M23 family metallopeptidase [Anaerolineae bacterium]